LFYKTESAKGSKRITSVNAAALKLLSTRLHEIGHDRFGRSYFLLDDIGLHPSVTRKDITTRTALRVFTLDPQKSQEGLRAFSRVEDIQRLVDWLRADIYSENKATILVFIDLSFVGLFFGTIGWLFDNQKGLNDISTSDISGIDHFYFFFSHWKTLKNRK
jgi:hypothetical protein